jgi:hypothetical protein
LVSDILAGDGKNNNPFLTVQSYKSTKKLITKNLTRTWYPERDGPGHRLRREHPGRAGGRRRRVVAHHLGRGATAAGLLRRRRRLADKGHKVRKVVVTAAAAGSDRCGFLMVFGRGADLLGGVVGGGGEVPAASARWQACRRERQCTTYTHHDF